MFFLVFGSYVAPFFTEPLYLHYENATAGLNIAGARRLRTVNEMLRTYDMLQLNMNDMLRMNYGFRVVYELSARRLPYFNYRPAFEGKIWLLTCHLMSSGAQLASWVIKESGIATLVGDITRGVWGGVRTNVALPYSGIIFSMDTMYITDSHGRVLEAGTIPHYFNRDGMDALETVLAMISEGMY